MIDAIITFISELTKMIQSGYEVLQQTTESIDNVDFSDTLINQYLGYARYAMTDPVWFMLWAVILVSVGVSLFNFAIRSFNLIKSLFL